MNAGKHVDVVDGTWNMTALVSDPTSMNPFTPQIITIAGKYFQHSELQKGSLRHRDVKQLAQCHITGIWQLKMAHLVAFFT
jgi:hypothetical protein